MVYKKIKNIFLFVIICVNFNIICMKEDSNSNKLECDNHGISGNGEISLKQLGLDNTEIDMAIADLKQDLMELFGENVEVKNSQKKAAKGVINCLSGKNFEEIVKKCRKDGKNTDIRRAVLKKYRNKIIGDLKLAYGIEDVKPVETEAEILAKNGQKLFEDAKLISVLVKNRQEMLENPKLIKVKLKN